MAYLLRNPPLCDEEGCFRPAELELYNCWHQPRGTYCERHGLIRRDQQNELDKLYDLGLGNTFSPQGELGAGVQSEPGGEK
jgi:hypothetical protein